MKLTLLEKVKSFTLIISALIVLSGCVLVKPQVQPVSELTHELRSGIVLTHGIDESAGGDASYIITTANATYYLEKQGGGLSSMLDADGVDWLGFHKKKGSGHKGEYRGFPNAIHKQDGNYFHALNAGTDLSTSIVNIENDNHVQITFTSGNGKWQGQWDFYPERLDFTMTKVSEGYKYWVQYEGVPNGEMNDSDFWFSADIEKKQRINTPFLGDLATNSIEIEGISKEHLASSGQAEHEWIAFGDVNSSRMLYLLHHENDEHPDNYVSRPDMTVFGFGRSNKNKFLTTPQTFSIGFVESAEYHTVKSVVESIVTAP